MKTVYEKLMANHEFAKSMAKGDLIMDFTEKLLEILGANGISIDELAKMIDDNENKLNGILSGEHDEIGLNLIVDVAFALGYDVRIKFCKYKDK